MLKTLGIGAALALAANSFMIPPTISLESVDMSTIENAFKSAAALTIPDPRNHLMKMDCPGCPFAESIERHHRITWSHEAVDNSLLLNFSVGADPKTLELNGAQFYPPLFGLWSPFIEIPQVESTVGLVDIRTRPAEYTDKRLILTAYAWHFDRPVTASDSGAEIIPMTLRIDAIEGFKVNVPSVTLKVIKDNEGNVMIISVASDAVEEPKEIPSGQAEQINNCNRHRKFCKWRSMIQAKIACLKTCLARLCGRYRLSKHPKHPKPAIVELNEHKVHETPGHHKFRQHHKQQPEQHGHHNHFFHAFGRGLKFVLIPVLIGIAAGFVVYGVGMALGLVIAYIWVAIRKMRGTRRGNYATVAQDEIRPDIKDVKDMEALGLVNEGFEDAPPVYKDNADDETA